LGNDTVDGVGRKPSRLLKPTNKTVQFSPGNLIREFQQEQIQIIQVSADISVVIFQGMGGQVAEEDHLPANT